MMWYVGYTSTRDGLTDTDRCVVSAPDKVTARAVAYAYLEEEDHENITIRYVTKFRA